MKDWESLRAPFRPWWSQRLIMALWHLNFKVYRSLPTIVSHHYTRGLIVLFFPSTVCRSCIVRYLQDRDDNKCPSCSILIHETNPFEMLRYLRSCLVCYHVVWSLPRKCYSFWSERTWKLWSYIEDQTILMNAVIKKRGKTAIDSLF